MGDLGINAVDGASSSGIFSNLALASNDRPQSSVEAWTGAMTTASRNRAAAEQSQSDGASASAADKPKAPDNSGGGSWLDRGLGVLQAGVGVLETVGGVVGGVLTSETGVGAVAGGVVALHGLDDIQAGVRQAWTGKPTETFTQQAVTSGAQRVGVPPAAAAVIGMGVDIVASGGVGGAEKAAVKGTEEAISVGRDLAKTKDLTTAEEGTKGLRAIEHEPARPPSEPEPKPKLESPALKYPDGIPPAEGARLTEGVRSSLQLKGRNVAVAEVNVGGKSEMLTAVSGKASPRGTVPAPENPLFTTKPSGAMTRDYDSEVKLLDDVAKDLPSDARGTISLYTERAPCNSCEGVIQQFRDRFPGINLIVTHGE